MFTAADSDLQTTWEGSLRTVEGKNFTGCEIKRKYKQGLVTFLSPNLMIYVAGQIVGTDGLFWFIFGDQGS